METGRIFVCGLWVLVCVSLVGCGSKADENKPVGQIKAEVEKMNVKQLRSMAVKYKDAIMAKKGDMDKVTNKLKDIPVTKLFSDEAKGLKAEIEGLNKSVSALNERFKIYFGKLKEKGGDLSGLKI
ncbi:hypothetical protein ACFL3G_03290 [Planctomycetota bacterium]